MIEPLIVGIIAAIITTIITIGILLGRINRSLKILTVLSITVSIVAWVKTKSGLEAIDYFLLGGFYFGLMLLSMRFFLEESPQESKLQQIFTEEEKWKKKAFGAKK